MIHLNIKICEAQISEMIKEIWLFDNMNYG